VVRPRRVVEGCPDEQATPWPQAGRTSDDRQRCKARAHQRLRPTAGVRRVIEQARDLPQLADPMDAEILTGRALTEAALSVSSTPLHASLPPGMSLTFDDPLPDRSTAPDPSAPPPLPVGEASPCCAPWRSWSLTHPPPLKPRRRLTYWPPGDVPGPPWTRAILDLEPADCWIADDQAQSGYVTVVCAYRYQGRQHALAVFIDHMMGGLAKNAFATAKPDELQERFSLVPASPAEAHRRVAEAYRLVYAHPGLPVDPDVHRLRMLVRRRIRQTSSEICGAL